MLTRVSHRHECWTKKKQTKQINNNNDNIKQTTTATISTIFPKHLPGASGEADFTRCRGDDQTDFGAGKTIQLGRGGKIVMRRLALAKK